MKSIQERLREDYKNIALENHEESILVEADTTENVSSSVGYTEEDLALAPVEANLGLGCGNPHRKADNTADVVCDYSQKAI